LNVQLILPGHASDSETHFTGITQYI